MQLPTMDHIPNGSLQNVSLLISSFDMIRISPIHFIAKTFYSLMLLPPARHNIIKHKTFCSTRFLGELSCCSCHWLNLIGSSVDPVQLLDTILYWQRANNNYRLRTGSEFNYRLGSGSGFNYRLCIGSGSGFKTNTGYEDHKNRSKTNKQNVV